MYRITHLRRCLVNLEIVVFENMVCRKAEGSVFGPDRVSLAQDMNTALHEEVSVLLHLKENLGEQASVGWHDIPCVWFGKDDTRLILSRLYRRRRREGLKLSAEGNRTDQSVLR